MAERIDVVDIEFGNSQQEADKLTKSLDELKQELYSLEKGSDAYNKKLQEVAAETKRLTAINEELEQSTQSAGEKFESVLGAAAGFAGAIQIAEGTLQAFGIQSEAAEEAIAKLQGVMAITDGLRTIKENAKAITDLTKLIKNSAIAQRLFTSTKKADIATTNAQTAATVGYTTATTTATIATKALKTALITSGIGAVLVGIGYAVDALISKFTTLKDDAEEGIDIKANIKEQTDAVIKDSDKLVEKMQLASKTAAERQEYLANQTVEHIKEIYDAGWITEEEYYTNAVIKYKEQLDNLTKRREWLESIKPQFDVADWKEKYGEDEAFINEQIGQYTKLVDNFSYLTDVKYDDAVERYNKLMDISKKFNKEELAEFTKIHDELYSKLSNADPSVINESNMRSFIDFYNTLESQSKDIIEGYNKRIDEYSKSAEEFAKKQKELAKTIKDVNAELDKAYREIELNQMNSRDAERERLKDNYDSQISELDSYLAQRLITQEKYQQLSVAYMNEYNRKLIDLEEQWAKEDADAEKARYEEKLQVQRDYISKYINNVENDMIEGLRSLNEAVEKSANDPLQNIFDREKLLAQEKIYLEETIKTYKEIISTLAPELQEEMNSYLVQLEERLSVNASSIVQLLTEKVQTYSNIISESLSTTSSFMNDIASFGEGVSSEWISVTDIISESVSTIGEQLSTLTSKIKDGQADWKDYGQVVASSLTSAFQIGAGMMSALAAKQQQIINDIDGNDAASMKRKAEAFEKQKKYEIAGATMSMLGGITAAIATAFQLGPIAGPIVGGINAALVAAQGGIQIAQIKKQKNPYGGGGGGSSSSNGSDTAAPALSALQMMGQGVNPTTEIKGVSVEEDVRDTKVYVTETDVRNTMNRVRVTEQEATF